MKWIKSIKRKFVQDLLDSLANKGYEFTEVAEKVYEFYTPQFEPYFKGIRLDMKSKYGRVIPIINQGFDLRNFKKIFFEGETFENLKKDLELLLDILEDFSSSIK